MTRYEDHLVKEYHKAYKNYHDTADRVGAHFMHLAKTALRNNDVTEARRALDACPDSVTRCFIMDAIGVWERGE